MTLNGEHSSTCCAAGYLVYLVCYGLYISARGEFQAQHFTPFHRLVAKLYAQRHIFDSLSAVV